MLEPAMSPSALPVPRLLFAADAAVAEGHDPPPDARALLSAATEDSRGHATGDRRP